MEVVLPGLILAVAGYIILYFVIKAAVKSAIEETRHGVAPQDVYSDPSMPQKTCPHCGKTHDFDYPRCPHCGYAY